VRGPEGCNLFVYNIPEYFSEEQLQHLFGVYGPLVSAKVQRDRVTNATRGFGFVSFAERGAAQSAIANLDGLIIDGKKLAVRLKTSAQENAAQQQQQLQQHMQQQQQQHQQQRLEAMQQPGALYGLRYATPHQSLAAAAQVQQGRRLSASSPGSGFSPLFSSSPTTSHQLSGNGAGGASTAHGGGLSVQMSGLSLGGGHSGPGGNMSPHAAAAAAAAGFFTASSAASQPPHAAPSFDAVVQQAMYLQQQQQQSSPVHQSLQHQHQAHLGQHQQARPDFGGPRLFDAYAQQQQQQQSQQGGGSGAY